MAEIKTKILLRNDTAAQWTSVNPVLGKGEMGIEIDTCKMKIGDGVKTWSQLDYAGGERNTYRESIDGDGQYVGDVAVIKTEIAGGKYSYTSYVWNGENWAAMDGNYNANNVYFSEDLLTTSAIGNISLTGGQATISAAGKNLTDVWQTIFVKENKSFTVTQPSVSFKSATPGTDPSRIVYLEVGSSGTASMEATYSDGEYQYGYTTESQTGSDGSEEASNIVNNKTTGANITHYAYTDGVSTVDNTLTTHASSTISFTAESGTSRTKANKKVTVKVAYDDGEIPVSNLKKKYASKKIVAGNKTATTSQDVFRWYVPMYHGFTYAADVVADPSKVTGSKIQSLTNITGATAYNETKPTTATATKAWRQYFVAIPSSYGTSIPKIKDGNGIDCTVKEAGSISFQYGSGSDATIVGYKVYYVNNAADYDTLSLQITW